MEQTLNETLLEDVKSRLRITWNDEDKQLIKQLNEERRIYKNFVVRLFFEEEDQVKQLLIERCRYEYNNGLEDFEKNFRGELQRLILESALKERTKGEVIQ